MTKTENKQNKRVISVSIQTENFAFLKWLNLNYSEKYSHIVDKLLTAYKSAVVEGMTDYEKEQIGNLKTIVDNTIFEKSKIDSLRKIGYEKILSDELVVKMITAINDPEKRKQISDLLDE